MYRKLSALAALAALTLTALVSGGASASAGAAQLQQNPAAAGGNAGVILAQYNCAGGSTDCPTWINRNPHYGEYRRYHGDRRWHQRDWGPRYHHRRDWEPRYHRRYIRPHLGIQIAPVYPQPRYRHAPRMGMSGAHVNWCYNRYRSYRAWDNTFQPYHGPRQQCWSPYS